MDAQGHPVNGVTLVWTSSDTTVATVDATGLIKAVDLGEAEIDVSAAGASAQVVGPTTNGGRDASARGPALGVISTSRMGGGSRLRTRVVPRIRIAPTNPQTIDVGGTVTYIASAVDNHGDQPSNWRVDLPTWKSSKSAVAPVTAAGVATGVGQGTTNISATIFVHSRHSDGYYTSAVKLTVAACGGITAVKSWTVDNFKTIYNPSPLTVQVATYSIDQSTSALSGTLILAAQPNADSAVWEGVVTGTARVNNGITVRESGQVYTSTESSNGSTPLLKDTRVRLTVKRTQPAGCRYFVTYDDGFDYTSLAANGTATNSSGDGFTMVVDDVPSGPGPDKWVLTGTNRTVDAIPGSSVVIPLIGYYMPETDLSTAAAALATTTATISWGLHSN